MQPGLIQALMNVLPSGLEGMPARVLQGNGTVDFAGFLQSMLPALQQQMEGLPAEERASLMAEFQRGIRSAQEVAEVQGPEGKALDAMLEPGAAPSDEPADKVPASVIEQLFAMLGDPSMPVPPGAIVAQLARGQAGGNEAAGETIPPMPQEPISAESEMNAALGAAAGVDAGPARIFPAADTAPVAGMGAVTLAQSGVSLASAGMSEARTLAPSVSDGKASVEVGIDLPRHDGPASEGPGRGQAGREGQGAAMRDLLAELPGFQSRGAEAAGRSQEAGSVIESAAPAPEAPLPAPSMFASDQPRARGPQDLPLLERIPVPLHQQREFGEAVGQRLMLMVGREMQGARIELNPVDLGPMEINLQLRGNEATVHFGAAHAVTREAIEAALPRLREMLAEQGFTQVNVNVGQQQGQNAQAFNGQGGQGGGQGWPAGSPEAEAVEPQLQTLEYPLRAGGLDLFA